VGGISPTVQLQPATETGFVLNLMFPMAASTCAPNPIHATKIKPVNPPVNAPCDFLKISFLQ